MSSTFVVMVHSVPLDLFLYGSGVVLLAAGLHGWLNGRNRR